MDFLIVGNTLDNDINVTNTDGYKPLGCIWASKYYNDTYNEWIDYLTCNPYLIYYKYKDNIIPIIKITVDLKNILLIDNKEVLNEVIKKYNHNNWIDFEALSKDYDGIYIKLCALDNFNIYNCYSVNSLIIFNKNCIIEKNEGTLNINICSNYQEIENTEYTMEFKKVLKKS